MLTGQCGNCGKHISDVKEDICEDCYYDLMSQQKEHEEHRLIQLEDTYDFEYGDYKY